MLLASCVNTPIDHRGCHGIWAMCSASCVNGAEKLPNRLITNVHQFSSHQFGPVQHNHIWGFTFCHFNDDAAIVPGVPLWRDVTWASRGWWTSRDVGAVWPLRRKQSSASLFVLFFFFYCWKWHLFLFLVVRPSSTSSDVVCDPFKSLIQPENTQKKEHKLLTVVPEMGVVDCTLCLQTKSKCRRGAGFDRWMLHWNRNRLSAFLQHISLISWYLVVGRIPEMYPEAQVSFHSNWSGCSCLLVLFPDEELILERQSLTSTFYRSTDEAQTPSQVPSIKSERTVPELATWCEGPSLFQTSFHQKADVVVRRPASESRFCGLTRQGGQRVHVPWFLGGGSPNEWRRTHSVDQQQIMRKLGKCLCFCCRASRNNGIKCTHVSSVCAKPSFFNEQNSQRAEPWQKYNVQQWHIRLRTMRTIPLYLSQGRKVRKNKRITADIIQTVKVKRHFLFENLLFFRLSCSLRIVLKGFSNWASQLGRLKPQNESHASWPFFCEKRNGRDLVQQRDKRVPCAENFTTLTWRIENIHSCFQWPFLCNSSTIYVVGRWST